MFQKCSSSGVSKPDRMHLPTHRRKRVWRYFERWRNIKLNHKINKPIVEYEYTPDEKF